MKYVEWLLLSIFVFTVSAVHAADSSISNTYLIRHAEKELNVSDDPALTEQGHQRAQYWASFFADIKLDAIYSTDTTRTRDTAAPIAAQQGLAVSIYDARNIDYQAFQFKNAGKAVLVVGHSNTIPAFTNALVGAEDYKELDESNYSTLFMVDIVGDSRQARMISVDQINAENSHQTPINENKEKTMPTKQSVNHEKIDYLEFPAADIEATKAFFTKAFAWQFEDYGPDYAAFSDQGLNGGFFRSELKNLTSNGGALAVLYSDDLEATEQKVKAAGGVIVKAIFSFPGGRRFHFTEPSGNELAVWTTE